MTAKQTAKHIADRQPQPYVEKPAFAEPTPDGLGAWEGGTAALKGSRSWVSEKSHASRTADAKNTPGIDYASKIGPEHQKVTDETNKLKG